jgi:hypothetical protein
LNLRALLVCEDVRVEVDGTLTLIGVRNDRLRVRAQEPGPIVLDHLSFLLVVGGLTGVERIGFRERIRHVNDDRPAEQPLAYEAHNPTTDEHNFVFGHSPMVFPDDGRYEVIVDVETALETTTYRHRFGVERAAD